MRARRSSGPQAHAAKSALAQPAEIIESLYSEIFKGLPWGIVILQLENPQDARTFRILWLNPAVTVLTGATPEDLRGKALSEFPELLKTSFPDACLEVLASGEGRNLGEFPYGNGRIQQGTYAVQIFPLPASCVCVALENVTNRKQAELGMRESEERLRSFVQAVREYAIFQLDPNGRVINWTSGAERMKGYRAEEIIGKHFSKFYLPEDVESGKPEQVLKEAATRGQSEDEGWRVRKDGSRFWASVVVTALRNSEGTLRGFVKITRDITERHEKEEALTKAKELLELRVEQRAAVLAQVNEELRGEITDRRHAEEQLQSSLDQLRALAAHIQNVREEERTSIAREIHDELGQACTAIKMDLALIGRRLTKRQSQLKARVDSAIALVDNAIGTLRRIASQLRPRTLDDLGLSAALEWQAQEFQARTGIACQLTLPREPIALDTERSTAIFRIFQESLTNVARHAHATRVEARLERGPTEIIFEVHDNGVGFDPAQINTRPSFGLVGMQERAILLNGDLKVEGIPGGGTTLTLKVPLLSSPLSSQDSKCESS